LYRGLYGVRHRVSSAAWAVGVWHRAGLVSDTVRRSRVSCAGRGCVVSDTARAVELSSGVWHVGVSACLARRSVGVRHRVSCAGQAAVEVSSAGCLARGCLTPRGQSSCLVMSDTEGVVRCRV
jgi:hypothetical protein